MHAEEPVQPIVTTMEPDPQALNSQNADVATRPSLTIAEPELISVNRGHVNVLEASVGATAVGTTAVVVITVGTAVGFGTGRVGHVLGACAGDSVGVSGSR